MNQLARGRQRKGSPFTYVAPDVRGQLHNSMNKLWNILECIPKADRYKEWTARRSKLGYYIPNAEPRLIAPDSLGTSVCD